VDVEWNQKALSIKMSKLSLYTRRNEMWQVRRTSSKAFERCIKTKIKQIVCKLNEN
jgi:hypothetical protein